MFVLKFLDQNEIKQFIDPTAYEVVEYLLKKVAFSQPEVHRKDERSGIQITKEFLEDWIAQACNLQKIGAGNYPIDVYSLDEKYGADVKFMTCKTTSNGDLKDTLSNETSLAQNFKDAGKSLDQLFANKRFKEILDLWIDLLSTKVETPIDDLGLEELYYFIFLRAKNRILLGIAKLNIDKLHSLEVINGTSTSVFVRNFLEEKYGNVKIYKSKKRMELRLSAYQLEIDNKTISWNFENLDPNIINLRDVATTDEIKKHAQNEFKRFFEN